MTSQFFNTALSAVPARIAPVQKKYRLLLDKNEQSHDVPANLKQKMANALMDTHLNRYPEANLLSLEEKTGNYCGLPAECIAMAPGSASIITTLLNYFAIGRKRIIINQPSYSLFEYHCNTYNIPYEPWLLNDEMQFDIDTMPVPDANSVVIITSPNNPVGNAITPAQLQSLLTRFPGTLFLVDAVYCEFGSHNYTGWVEHYSNLMVIRSFSKAFPAAGIRLGYLCAQPRLVNLVKKLLLPFSINSFTRVFANEVLFDPRFMEECKNRVRNLVAERERLYRFVRLYFDASLVKVHASQGNFLLVTLGNTLHYQTTLHYFDQAGIKVLPVQGTGMPPNSLRITIGTPAENDLLLEALVAVPALNREATLPAAA